MFVIEGYTAPPVRDAPRVARVVWIEPPARGALEFGLDGDLVVIARARRDALDGVAFRSTPTGPFFPADLDDPVAALVQLTSYFADDYRLEGDVPVVPIDPLPEGAIP